MDIYGIKNISDKHINFKYDSYYRNICLALKNNKNEEERQEIIKLKEASELLGDIDIDLKTLQDNFMNIIIDDNSSKYLWILYSKYKNGENYIDKISDIFRQENKVIRSGTNTYKVNGWMAHTLYVYQIANYNIAKNIELFNFNGNKENAIQVCELHELYKKLTKEEKFILKIFTLIHDIGVIESVEFHDKLGYKYVEKVLDEININQDTLNKANIFIDMNDLITILKEFITYHTLITLLGSESSDLYVKQQYEKMVRKLPKIIEGSIAKILILLAYGDIIGVDESLMNSEKYARIKTCYNFFDKITKGENVKRDKEKIAIERICDMIGEVKVESLQSKFDYILNKYNINKRQFVEDMYNIKLMRYTGVLMKNLNDTEMTIRIYYELFELIGCLEDKESLKNYTVTFIPDRHENEFVKQFKNNSFFECIKQMKNSKKYEITYKNINITIKESNNEKYLNIKVI